MWGNMHEEGADVITSERAAKRCDWACVQIGSGTERRTYKQQGKHERHRSREAMVVQHRRPDHGGDDNDYGGDAETLLLARAAHSRNRIRLCECWLDVLPTL